VSRGGTLDQQLAPIVVAVQVIVGERGESGRDRREHQPARLG
jgi:hypothetical protein